MEHFMIKVAVTGTARDFWVYDYPIDKPKCKSVTSIYIEKSRKGYGQVYLELFTYNKDREIEEVIYSNTFLFGDNESSSNVYLKLSKDKNIGFSGRVCFSNVESPLVLVQINFDESQDGNVITPCQNTVHELTSVI